MTRRAGPVRSPSGAAVGAVLALLVASAAACGSGGGGRTGAPRSSTTTRAPAPSTTTTLPGPGAVGPWAGPVPVSSGRPLAALSCPTAVFCVALDDMGTAYTYNGTAWSSGVSLASPAAVASGTKAFVSCVSATFCMAVPVGNQVNTWDGTAWSAPVTVGGIQRLQALSCATDRFCVTVDGDGNAFAFTARGWLRMPAAGGGPSAVSCVSPAFCIAVEGSNAAVWNGQGWSPPEEQDTQGELLSVSCTSATFCVAGDTEGGVIVWNGSSWAPAVTVDPASSATSTGNLLAGMSCVGTTFCVASTTGGQVVSFDGQRWSAPTSIGAIDALTAVSCSSPSFCAAVDAAGNAFTLH